MTRVVRYSNKYTYTILCVLIAYRVLLPGRVGFLPVPPARLFHYTRAARSYYVGRMLSHTRHCRGAARRFRFRAPAAPPVNADLQTLFKNVRGARYNNVYIIYAAGILLSLLLLSLLSLLLSHAHTGMRGFAGAAAVRTRCIPGMPARDNAELNTRARSIMLRADVYCSYTDRGARPGPRSGFARPGGGYTCKTFSGRYNNTQYRHDRAVHISYNTPYRANGLVWAVPR